MPSSRYTNAMMTFDEALDEIDQLRKELNDANSRANKLKQQLAVSTEVLEDALLERDMIPARRLRKALEKHERGYLRKNHLLVLLPEYKQTAKACSPYSGD